MLNDFDIEKLFQEIPTYNKYGYSFDSYSNRSLSQWFTEIRKLAEIDDSHIQENIFEKLIFLLPVYQKDGPEFKRVFCTLCLKYFQSLSNPGKRLQEIMIGTIKKMLKWEELQAGNNTLSHHYICILQEYLSFLNEVEKVPPYLNFHTKQITKTVRYRRIYFEHPVLRRELYCDLWHPEAAHSQVIIYHITGYSSRNDQQKRRYTHPASFTRNYLKLIEQFPDKKISFCVIPCPYEDVYNEFLCNYIQHVTEELFATVEQVCGYKETNKRGLSAFSKGSFYGYNLNAKKATFDAIVTHSGALLETFNADKRSVLSLTKANIPVLVTSGKKDSLLNNNNRFVALLREHGVSCGKYFYDGTHRWNDVEPTFSKGLSWLVKQLVKRRTL